MKILLFVWLAVATTSAAIAQPMESAWHREVTRDSITDAVTQAFYRTDSAGLAVLRLECTNEVLAIKVLYEEIYPNRPGQYFVDYRFDDKPGVQRELWVGVRGMAQVARDGRSNILSELWGSRQFLVRLPTLDRGFIESTFMLDGFNDEFKQFPSGCWFQPPPEFHLRRY